MTPSGESTSGAKGPSATTAWGGVERTFGGFDPPMCVGAVKGTRIPAHDHAAERRKARRIGLGHGERVGHAGGMWPVHSATKDRREARLEVARSIGIEGVVRHAELVRERKLTFQRLERAIAAIELEPARLAQEALRAGLRQQRFVLRERARK